MTEEQFWKIISHVDQVALIGGQDCGEETVEPVIEALKQLSIPEIEEFQAHLNEKVKALYTGPYADSSKRNSNHPWTDDGFYYLAFYVVGNGREFYDSVISDPRKIPGVQEGLEDLMYVSPEAASRKTGTDYEEWDYLTE